jgi:RNA polymerase sigma-70 factor, ECF subfamily
MAMQPTANSLDSDSRSRVDDEQLVVAAKHHDAFAFETLMRRYNRRLFRIARSVLLDDAAAEDAVQECYVRAFTNLHQYQPTGSFGAWLTRLALNEALMMKRRTKRAMLSIDDVEDRLGDDAGEDLLALSTPDSTNAASARQLLEQAIDALPQVFRTVFILRVVEQLSTAETAASLDINEATVKSRLHRAHARLRTDISRRLRREHLTLFEFGGERCDRIVFHVLARLAGSRADAALVPSS